MNCVFILLMIISVGALAAPSDKAVEEFFKDKTKIENPFELRDPFKSPQLKSSRASTTGTGIVNKEARNAELLETMPVLEMKVVGVLIAKERRAVIKGPNEKDGLIFVKEGTKIGPDKAEVKAILPGGIVLVEKMINVYGQEEYLETVIPISK